MSVLSSTQQAARKVERHPALEALTRFGLGGYGVLHLAVAYLTLMILTGRPAVEGDQSGAFRVLAAQAWGRVLVWAIAVGLVAMAIWQLVTAIVGDSVEQGVRRTVDRWVSVARAIVYAALAWTAFKVVAGAPASNAAQQQRATGGVLAHSGGPLLVGLAGVVVVVVGLVIAWYGLTKDFERRLKRSQMSRTTRRTVVLTGQIGYTVKGLAYAIVGVLLVIAAVTFDPSRSTGLDGALRTLADQPDGRVLLGIVALGFAIHGVFCFFQVRFRRV
jgi:Domain of Unknown Function (DUF1206)